MQVIIPLHERELLSQLQSGNEKAFKQLYRIYSLQIFKKLLRLVKQEEVAKADFVVEQNAILSGMKVEGK